MLMKKISTILFLCTAFFMAACEKSENGMKCGDYDVSISINDDVLDVIINGDEVVLNQTISASGARYEGNLNDTVVVLWSKGSDWTLYLNDGEPIECKN